jgi:hypothetical protein
MTRVPYDAVYGFEVSVNADPVLGHAKIEGIPIFLASLVRTVCGISLGIAAFVKFGVMTAYKR